MLKLSLKYRIAAVIFVLEAIMMATVLTMTLNETFSSNHNQIKNNEQVLLDLLVDLSQMALFTSEFDVLQLQFEDIILDSNIEQVVVLDENDVVVVGSQPGDVGSRSIKFENDTLHHWRFKEITNAVGKMGEIAIRFSHAEMLAANQKAQELGITIALVGMILIAIVGMAIGYLLTRRINKLTQAAQRMAEGDLSVNADLKGHDEIAVLGQTFDRMARKMEKNVTVIKDAHNDLEEKVKELALARDEAMAASSTKSMFLTNMSHEIRTPMNAVLGYTQILLRDTAFPKNYRKQVQTIENAGAHLLDLINDILDLSNIEAGSMEIHTQDFDLIELLNGLSYLFEGRCQKRGLTWTLENRIRGPGLVNGDQGKLRQILINFLGNAVKFTDQGEVKLTASNSGERYLFEATNPGIGISSSELANINEPFHQAAVGIKKGGTGLGLAISQRQLELLGSKLRVDSEPGKGSRFYFQLEFPDAKAAVQARSSRGEQPLHLAPGYTVNALVVDDVEDNRDVLQHMLQTTGITVRTAVNGKDALDKINEQIPDIVFMDIRMPEMNGNEALKRVRADYADQSIVCIGVTSSALAQEMKRYLDEGFDDIIGKPFRFGEIYYRIEKYLSVKLIENQHQLESQPDTAEEIKHRHIELIQGICLPEALYSRLREAAKFNALTDIEEIISELSELGGEPKSLSIALQDYISNYDTDGILKMLEEISYA